MLIFRLDGLFKPQISTLDCNMLVQKFENESNIGEWLELSSKEGCAGN